ncbi:unnamed protein product [Cuscuta epithymum]|uniref:Uncharacterized protein n=1 Tax=Cuscuta epithymum TaxID=186058 RepID=A0AAV0C9Q1_9ASTE|nr:unnamed protein product [Cuscuta epithymum]
MAAAMLKRTTMLNSMVNRLRSYASVAVGTDLVSGAPNVSLQKARTWDEGVSSKFSTTLLKDIFKAKKLLSSDFRVLSLEFVQPNTCLAIRVTLTSLRPKELTQ